MADDKGDSESVPNVRAEPEDDTHWAEQDHSPQFVPLVTLPEVPVMTMEEDEVEMVKLRAKLFRYDTQVSPPEWKERGTGDVKLLRHTIKNCCRVVMRREKTYKICANHYITPWMELKPNCGSDRAWVYSVPADYADEQIRPELLAIKFGNAENAQKWKDIFEEAKNIVHTQCSLYCSDASYGDDDDESESTDDDEDGDRKVEDSQDKTTAKPAEPQQDSATQVADQLEKLTVTTETNNSEKSEEADDK